MFRFVYINSRKQQTKRNETTKLFLKNLFIKRNETMISFEDFWRLLYEHGSRNYYKNETRTRWEALSEEQQQTLYDRISEKIRAGKYVDFNPLEAIHDNLPRTYRPFVEPINYAGKPLPRKGVFYFADYNGKRGLYTEEVVRA